MENMSKLMVGLDLTPMDDTLIGYTAFLSQNPNIKRVYFIHVEKSLEIPEELQQGIPDNGPPGERILHSLEERIYPLFEKLNHVQVEILVKEGSPLKELLHWTKEKQANLMLVGRKLRLHGSGVLAQKIVRTGRTGVLFVPETAEYRLKRVVVSIDFSEYSMLALDRVLNSKILPQNTTIVCLHAYEVPTGYITLGVSYEDFDDRMKGFAREKYEQLLNRFPEMRERGEFKLVRHEYEDNVGELLVMEAKRARADMLVIGAKGKSAAALFVLGSVTEKVLRYDIDIPLAVFRKENEGVGFLDAILNI